MTRAALAQNVKTPLVYAKRDGALKTDCHIASVRSAVQIDWSRNMTTKALVAIATTGLVWMTATGSVAAQQTSVADFFSNFAGWVANTEDYEAVEGSPSPVTGDPAHPYYSNATARRLGVSSNYRVADLTNPNVKPWANEIMKRENEKVLGGGIGFTARSSCMPAGVPTFAAFAAVQPIYFVQTHRVRASIRG